MESNNNKKTIMDLYYGHINPVEMPMVREEEYLAVSKKYLDASEEFASKLSPELRKEFEKVCEAGNNVDSELHIDGFCKGFQLGLRLASEANDIGN